MTTNGITHGTSHHDWSRELEIAVWIAQGLLGLVFALTGLMRIGVSAATVADASHWPGAVPGIPVRFIGWLELAGAVGVVLPALSEVGPTLTTPVVATGLVAVMAYANIPLFWSGDIPMLLINFTLGALAAFVAWIRFGKTAIG